MSSYLYKLFTHEVPVLHLAITFALVHLCIYAYLCIFRGSFLTLFSLAFLIALGFRMIAPGKEGVTSEWLSEDDCKTIYKGLYIGLNRAAGYFRSAIQLRGGFKAVAKAVAFLYLSIAFKFLGDRLAIYLCKQ